MTQPRTRRSLRAVFAIPCLLGAATLAGLLAALLGEADFWRWGSWLALSAPIAAIVVRIVAANAPSH